jgi:indole-3-acetate monooxygenase
MSDSTTIDRPVLAAAAEVSATARAHAAETEQGRALPPGVLAALREHGMFRQGVPSRLGGSEVPPDESLAVAEAIAGGDASTGWCVSITTAASLLGAYLPPEGGQEVFGDPRAVAVGVWAPTGRGRPVDGGVVISGRWAFCSGIPHADWLFAGFVLTPADGEAPVPRVAALRRSDLEVLDTWHTTGLRGTGSHDVLADEVFVPQHRICSVMAGPPADATALYRFPLIGYFALSVAAAAMGNARGALDDFRALAEAGGPGSRRPLAHRSTVQSAVAEAEAAQRAARAFFFQAVDDAWRSARSGEPVSLEQRMALRLAATHATRTAAQVVADLYDLAGSAAIYQSSPLQRRFRDAHTATAHGQVNPTSFRTVGRLLLGVPSETELL